MKAPRDGRHIITNISMRDIVSTGAKPCNDVSVRRNWVRQTKKFAIRKQSGVGSFVGKRGSNTNGAIECLSACRSIMESWSGGETSSGISRIRSWEGEPQEPFDFLECHICIGERVTEKEDGSRSNILIRCCITCHVEEFSLVFENFREREVESLLCIEGGRGFSWRGRMWLEILVGVMIGYDIWAQGRREEQSKVRGRNNRIRGNGIPLAELVSGNSFHRFTAEESCFSSYTGIIELSVPEFNSSKLLRE